MKFPYHAFGIAVTASFLSAASFAAGEFSEWDADGDGSITMQEWDAGLEEDGLFDNWDSDSDGLLSQDEFNEGFEATDSDVTYDYDSWDSDGDGLLSSDETSAGLYDTYDENDNDVIEEPEYDDFGDDVGDAGLFDV